MDSDPVKDSALLRQMTAGLSSEMRELERETADIQAQIKETRAACDAVHAKNANLKTLNEFREKEISMLLAKNESLEKQIAEYTDVIRPQLQNELKQVKELTKAKEKKYRDMIEKYEKKWAEYEVLYNKWPRVAELNALREKVKLVKIECMKKEQEAKELRQQAEQVYQAKVERLETLKKKYLECYAENQQVILKRQQIEREVEEIKARVALKKAAHQKRLEEEKQRKAAEVQNSMLDVVESAASASPISTDIKLHRFNIPEFKINFNTPLPSKELMSFSQGSAMLRSSPAATSYMDGGIRSANQPKPSTSSTTTQPNETATLTCSRENLQAPRAIHLNNSNVSEQLMGEVMEFSAGSKKLEDLVAPGQEIVEKPKSFKEVNNVICCSPLSKREVILSTDNIAARLRETIRPNLNVSEDLNKTLGPTSMTQSSRGSKVDVVASSTEVDLFSQEYRTSHQDTIEAIGIEEPEKVTNVNTVPLDSNQNMDQEKSSEPADFTGNSSDLSPRGENDNPPLEDDNCFDFNAEYGDEMYSLQSPPAFESAMSPAHAGFESSPSKDSEEAQSEVQDSGQPSASAFNAFSFFPKPSTANIFGGPSNSEQSGGENNKQSTSRFSFLF